MEFDNRRWVDFSPRTEAERRAYLHGRADVEAEAWEEVRRIRDKQLTAFFWGLFVGSTTLAVIAAVVNP